MNKKNTKRKLNSKRHKTNKINPSFIQKNLFVGGGPTEEFWWSAPESYSTLPSGGGSKIGGNPIATGNYYDDFVYDSNYGMGDIFQNTFTELPIKDVPIIDSMPIEKDSPLPNSFMGKSSTAWNNAWKSGNIASSVGSIAGGAVGVLQSSMANAKVADTSGIQAQIDAAANTTFGGATNEELMNQYSALSDIDRTSYKDLTGSTGQKALNTLSAVGQGAAAGSSVGGPVGAIVGGVLGLAGGITGWIVGDTKAKNEADRLNEEAEKAEKRRQANFDLAVNNLAYDNMIQDESSFYKDGGPLFNEFNNGITMINNGGTHSENPNDGIQIGVDPQGIPNLVEEGEVIFNDYVFSNRINVPDAIRTKYKLRGTKEVSFADAAKQAQKESEEMPNDSIAKRGLEAAMQDLMIEQEKIRMKKQNKKNSYSKGGKVNTYDDGSWMSYARYAPIVGNLAASMNDWFGGNEPDYSNLGIYEDAIKNANIKVSSSPVTTNLRFKPFDSESLLNRMQANQAASRRAIMNSSNANPAVARASILASDYAYNNQLGDLWRKIEEANYARQLGFEQFRTGLETTNRNRALQVATTNAELANKQAQFYGDLAQKRQAIKTAKEAEQSGNVTGLLADLGNFGKEQTYWDWLKMLQKNGIVPGPNGTFIQLPNTSTSTTPTAPNSTIEVPAFTPNQVTLEGIIASNGGKIRTKKKRRLS